MSAIRRSVALQAAQWFVQLSDGQASAQQQRAHAAWLAESQEHRLAWARATQIVASASRLPAAMGSAVLDRPRHAARRRAAVQGLALLILGVPGGWAAWKTGAWQQWTSTYATAIGERGEWTLADGSRIVLDSGSAVDLEFGADWRRLRLRAGAVFVETAPDPAVRHRPFVVQTPHGQARALGTRFTVRHAAAHSRVAVLQGAVEISVRQGLSVQQIAAGQEITFDARSIGAPGAVSVGEAQWPRGMLAVEKMRLDDFAVQLARYRRGIVGCDPAVAHLRVTGAFQLADTEAILLNVVNLLPVDVVMRTRYWVTFVPSRAADTA